MVSLHERWRAGRPEFLILTGASVGLVANVAWLTYDFATKALAAWPVASAVFGAGAFLSVLAAIVLTKRGGRTPRNFVFVGAIATALAVLSLAGLIGGGIALAGATWGVIQTYEPRA